MRKKGARKEINPNSPYYFIDKNFNYWYNYFELLNNLTPIR